LHHQAQFEVFQQQEEAKLPVKKRVRRAAAGKVEPLNLWQQVSINSLGLTIM